MSLYSVSKFFQSDKNYEDLIDKINTFCREEEKELTGISHSTMELPPIEVPQSPPTLGGSPIYIRSVVYTAIVFYSKRK